MMPQRQRRARLRRDEQLPNDDAEYLRLVQHERRRDLGAEHAPERRVLERGGGGRAGGLWRLRWAGRVRRQVLAVWADNANCDGTNADGTLHAFDLYANPLAIAAPGFHVTSSVPACDSTTNTQPMDFVINLSAAVNPGTVQASDFTVNGTPANSFVIGGGNTQITFHFNASPVTTQGLQTMHIAAGAFNDTGGNPMADFTCTFCFFAVQLAVTSTSPPVGGTFTPSAPGNYTYDVNFNQATDPASVSTSDLTITGTCRR